VKLYFSAYKSYYLRSKALLFTRLVGGPGEYPVNCVSNSLIVRTLSPTARTYTVQTVYLLLYLLPSERKLVKRGEIHLLLEIKGRRDVLLFPLPLIYLLSKLSSSLSNPYQTTSSYSAISISSSSILRVLFRIHSIYTVTSRISTSIRPHLTVYTLLSLSLKRTFRRATTYPRVPRTSLGLRFTPRRRFK
jgi:hypothetical protein